MNIKQKVSAAVATAVMVGGLMAPMASAADITVSGNGSNSTNNVTVVNSNNTTVAQGSATVAVTVVSSSATTGGNTANGNTGNGGVDVTSGNATSNVTTTVTGGSNVATVTPCGCEAPDSTIKVKDNRAKSKNTVTTVNSNSQVVLQGTFTGAGTFVGSTAKTGKNKANKNTGKGNVSVTSGNSHSTVTTTVTGGSNVLNP